MNTGERNHLRRVMVLCAASLSAGTGVAFAHGADELAPLRGNVWRMWDASPLIVTGCLAVLAIYFRGLLRRRTVQASNIWRAVSYTCAILLTYIVLQTPVDALSDHIFWVHRVQHVALHHWIPMLLALSAPIPELIRGLPSVTRRWLVKPVLRNRGVRKTYAFIQHPVVAPVLFVGLIYLWLEPALFQIATLDDNVHNVMHFSMLLEGIPFWWLMLDPKPGRVPYLGRIVILWAIMFPQIMLGAYITFTHATLYPVYAALDRGWVASYLIDQRLGGLVVWIPASMMSVIASVIVLRFWALRERRSSVTKGRQRVIGPAQQWPGGSPRKTAC